METFTILQSEIIVAVGFMTLVYTNIVQYSLIDISQVIKMVYTIFFTNKIHLFNYYLIKVFIYYLPHSMGMTLI